MAFEAKPDGSTNRIFVQISNYHGFYVVDFDARRQVKKVPMPELPFSQVDNDGLQGSPGHGLAVSPDGSQLWSTSKPNNHVYAWSLPDLDYLGGVAVGHHPDWLTMTPDGPLPVTRRMPAPTTFRSIDTEKLEQVAVIDVGQTPKRNHTLVIR